MVTHAHGQGYADPNFLIPETIDRVELFKGPYFPQFGDFATAGALKLITKETFKENFALAEGGSFDTQRYVLGASPQIGAVKTLFAGQAYYTNGPFINPEHLAQVQRHGALHARPRRPDRSSPGPCRATPPTGTRSGQIPRAAGGERRPAALRLGRPDRGRPDGSHERAARLDVDAERAGHLGGPCATARATSCASGRTSRSSPTAACASSWTRTAPSRTRATRRCGRTPSTSPATASIRATRAGCGAASPGTRGTGSCGVCRCRRNSRSTRATTTSTSRSSAQVRRTSFFTVNDVRVQERPFGGCWAQQIFFTDWLRFEGGLRGDFFIFDVANRLPRQGRDPNFTRRLPEREHHGGPGRARRRT